LNEPVIEVRNLSKLYIIGKKQRYHRLTESINNVMSHPIRTIQEAVNKKPTIWALKNVSFTVKQGEVIGIIGANGAGKSTLLKILSQITYPTRGEVRLKGRTGALLEVGTGFHPELTGRENIYQNGALLGMKKREIDNKFDEIVKFAEIEKFIDTPVKRYSSGMYVRLGFAVAAHLESDILIVDEVLAVGDARFQKKCLRKMKDVSEGGRTILFVSHDLVSVKKLCNRTLLLRDGKLISDGDTDRVIFDYAGENQDTILKYKWDDIREAPQNGSTVLLGVRICDQFGEHLDELTTDTPFSVEMIYLVKEEQTHIGLSLTFHDTWHNPIFKTLNNREPRCYGKPSQPGMYKSVIRIPGKLFNSGWFSISVNLIGKEYSDSRLIPEVLKFKLLDGPEVRGDYAGDYEGVLRPQLEWKTKKME